MLLASKAIIESKLRLMLSYDNPESNKAIILQNGDKIRAKIITLGDDGNGVIDYIDGKVIGFDYTVKTFYNEVAVMNSNFNIPPSLVHISIDISKDGDSKIVAVKFSDILDIWKLDADGNPIEESLLEYEDKPSIIPDTDSDKDSEYGPTIEKGELEDMEENKIPESIEFSQIDKSLLEKDETTEETPSEVETPSEEETPVEEPTEETPTEIEDETTTEETSEDDTSVEETPSEVETPVEESPEEVPEAAETTAVEPAKKVTIVTL